jgi:hypothetical protein
MATHSSDSASALSHSLITEERPSPPGALVGQRASGAQLPEPFRVHVRAGFAPSAGSLSVVWTRTCSDQRCCVLGCAAHRNNAAAACQRALRHRVRPSFLHGGMLSGLCETERRGAADARHGASSVSGADWRGRHRRGDAPVARAASTRYVDRDRAGAGSAVAHGAGGLARPVGAAWRRRGRRLSGVWQSAHPPRAARTDAA